MAERIENLLKAKNKLGLIITKLVVVADTK